MPELLKRERFTRSPDHGCPPQYRMGPDEIKCPEHVSRRLTGGLCFQYAGMLHGPTRGLNANLAYNRTLYCCGIITKQYSLTDPRAWHFWERNPDQWNSPNPHHIWWWKLCHSA